MLVLTEQHEACGMDPVPMCGEEAWSCMYGWHGWICGDSPADFLVEDYEALVRSGLVLC